MEGECDSLRLPRFDRSPGCIDKNGNLVAVWINGDRKRQIGLIAILRANLEILHIDTVKTALVYLRRSS